MRYMNEMDIELQAERHRNHPTLGPASQFLRHFMGEVNRHSDGWPYWSAPVKSAAKLMELVDRRWDDNRPVSADEVRKAIVPIKSFMTKRGKAAGMEVGFDWTRGLK